MANQFQRGLVKCELRVASYELRVAPVLRVASCELRVSSEKCELVHLNASCEFLKKTSNFHLLHLKNCDFLDSLYKIRDLQKSFLKGIDMVKSWPGPGQKYNLLYSTA